MVPCAQADTNRPEVGGPAWIRTKDQGIHVTEAFPPRVDYLFTPGQLSNYPVGCGTL